jgi:hypothetical protein
MLYGIITAHMKSSQKKKLKKITLYVPTDLLNEALKSGGDNLTQTVRKGLSLIAARKAYDGIRKMRGKVKFSISLDAMRYE